MESQIFHIFPNYFIHILKFSGVLSHNVYIKTSKSNTVYSIFGLVICFIVQSLSIPAVKYFENLHEDSPIEIVSSDRGSILTKFVKCFYPIIMSTTPLVAIINTLWKCKTLFPLHIKHVYESDRILKSASIFLQRQKKFARVFIICCLGLSVPIKVLSITTLVILHDVDNYLILFWVVSLYFADLVGFVTEIQFILICNSLRIRFNEINNRLESIFLSHNIMLEYRMRNFVKILKNHGTKMDRGSSKKLFTKDTKYPLKMNLKCRNQILLSKDSKCNMPIFVVPLGNSSFKENFSEYLRDDFASIMNKTVKVQTVDVSKQLHELRLSYRHLSAALSLLKSMYEYVLLASVFTSFLLILLNVYFVIYGFVKIFILSNRFDVFFWILKSLCRFTGLLMMCDLTGKEVRLGLVSTLY